MCEAHTYPNNILCQYYHLPIHSINYDNILLIINKYANRYSSVPIMNNIYTVIKSNENKSKLVLYTNCNIFLLLFL